MLRDLEQLKHNRYEGLTTKLCVKLLIQAVALLEATLKHFVQMNKNKNGEQLRKPFFETEIIFKVLIPNTDRRPCFPILHCLAHLAQEVLLKAIRFTIHRVDTRVRKKFRRQNRRKSYEFIIVVCNCDGPRVPCFSATQPCLT